jgi:hypothetical protein
MKDNHTHTHLRLEPGELFGEAALLDDTDGAPPFRCQVTQFTCFTSTKVQIRTPQATATRRRASKYKY